MGMTKIRIRRFVVLIAIGLLSFSSNAVAQTCADVCSTAKEGGVTESDDGHGTPMECCCLMDTEGAPLVEHPIQDCRY